MAQPPNTPNEEQLPAGQRTSDVPEPPVADEPTPRTPATEDREAGASDKPGAPHTPTRAQAQRKRRAPILIGAVMGLLLAVAVYMVWDQWFNHDDAQDIQGQWRVQGTQATINIDSQHIKLSDSVIYAYTIDTFAKKMTIGFSDLQGESTYEFSADRRTLTISDENFNPSSSAPEEVNGTASTVLEKISDVPDMSVSQEGMNADDQDSESTNSQGSNTQSARTQTSDSNNGGSSSQSASGQNAGSQTSGSEGMNDQGTGNTGSTGSRG